MEITCPKCSKNYEADTKECECGYIFTTNNSFLDWEVRSKLKTHISKQTRYKEWPSNDEPQNLSDADLDSEEEFDDYWRKREEKEKGKIKFLKPSHI